MDAGNRPRVLEVVDGQDAGAALALGGRTAEIGRSPTADLMLTDPAVGPHLARLEVREGALTIEPLDAAEPVTVNGRGLDRSQALRVGDLIAAGTTTMRVLWTPGHPLPLPRRDPGRPPSPDPEPALSDPPPPATTAPPTAAAGHRAAVGAVIGFALLAVAGFSLPTARIGGVRRDVWALDPAVALLGLALVTAAAVAAGLWAAELAGPRRPRAIGAAGIAVVVAGAMLTGFALFFIVAPLGGRGLPGSYAVLIAGLGVATAAVPALVMLAGAARSPGPRLGLTTAGAACLGGALLTLSGPLTWYDFGEISLAGTDDAILAGRLVIALGLLATVLGVGAAATATWPRRGWPRVAASAVAAIGAGALGLTLTAVAMAGDAGVDPGLTLAVAAAALVLAGGLAGLAGPLAATPPGPADSEAR